jgi:hypothetical protein
MPELLYGKHETQEHLGDVPEEKNFCIVIGRQYGSGGHDYG